MGMPSRARFDHAWALVGVAVLGAVGGLFLLVGARPVAWACWIAAPLWYALLMRRWWRRARLAREPFPPPWRDVLERNVALYRRLSSERKAAFERDVLVFIREHRFTAARDVELTDELKVLAAASAVMLVFGRTDLDYPRIAEIVFYPDAFDDEYRTAGRGRDIAGLVHPYGAVVLSVHELRRGFASAEDGVNVALHEFAHALDLSAQECDGLPLGIPPRLIRPWTEVMRREMFRARRGASVLRQYAGTNEAEFFATAVELFFERPELLRKGNAEVYALLNEYFMSHRG